MIEVSTGKAGQTNELLSALARGRHDHQFFSRAFLGRTLHDGQLEYVENATATVNVLATANRYGKTTVLTHRHTHANIYKTGAEPRYLDGDTFDIDQTKWLRLKYHTIHVADLWETSAMVWDDFRKLKGENPHLEAWVKNAPLSRPPYIDFIHGSKWKFNTLGHDASGIDGNSFYHVSIDEAGWIMALQAMMDNVVRVRVADVRGTIDIVGTFKPGISRDFYKFAVRASAYTGRGLTLDHRGDEDDSLSADSRIDQAIRKYLREFFQRERDHGRAIEGQLAADLAKIGVSLDEFADAATRGGP